MRESDKLNCLSYWFPAIRDAGLPVPRTEIVRTELELWMLCAGETVDGFDEFLGDLGAAVDRIGTPCFLRTGQGSNKHAWERTCYLVDRERLGQHVYNLAEWSELADFAGMPLDVWAVREMLPTMPVTVLSRYNNMPLCREFRAFVNGECVECLHPYWPREAVYCGFPYKEPVDWEAGEIEHDVPDGFDSIVERVQVATPDEWAEVRALASRAGEALPGHRWSVDVLETERGWYVTDMALAECSWHWPGCEHAKSKEECDG